VGLARAIIEAPIGARDVELMLRALA